VGFHEAAKSAQTARTFRNPEPARAGTSPLRVISKVPTATLTRQAGTPAPKRVSRASPDPHVPAVHPLRPCRAEAGGAANALAPAAVPRVSENTQ
jgi:hypothetical protein